MQVIPLNGSGAHSVVVVGLDEIVVSRQLLSDFASTSSEQLPGEAFRSIATYTLDKVQPKVIRFEEQVTTLREKLGTSDCSEQAPHLLSLADFYARNEDFTLAAQALAGIPLDSAGRYSDRTLQGTGLTTFLLVSSPLSTR
jgi:COP9 signalosome complex subunit 4